MMKSKWAILCIIITVTFGCSAEKPDTTRTKAKKSECKEPVDANLTQDLDDEKELVTFQDISPLIALHCTSCHGKDGDPDAPRIEGFAQLEADNFLLARLAVEVQGYTMPKLPEPEEGEAVTTSYNDLMESEDRRLFVQWAQDGFLKDKTSEPVKDVNWNISQKPTYSDNVAPVIEQNCMSCHADDQQPPELSNFATMKAENYKLALDIVVEVIEGDMPKLAPLSSSEQMLFQLWALQGFREQQSDPVQYNNQSLSEYLDADPEAPITESEESSADGDCL